MEFLLLREICYPESTLFRIHHFSVTKNVSQVFSLLRRLFSFLLASYKIPLKMQNKLHYDVPIKEVLHQQMKKSWLVEYGVSTGLLKGWYSLLYNINIDHCQIQAKLKILRIFRFYSQIFQWWRTQMCIHLMSLQKMYYYHKSLWGTHFSHIFIISQLYL